MNSVLIGTDSMSTNTAPNHPQTVRSSVHDNGSMLGEYRRALVFVLPYWRRLLFVLLISLFSTVLGLVQPYIAKLLIDEALLRRNMRALVLVAALMIVVTVVGFALGILASFRYVAV